MKTSEQTKEVFAALIAAMGEMKNPGKNADNPFYKSTFAPMDEIVDATRPILAKHGLAAVQDASGAAGTITVTTTIIHASGQWMQADGLTLPLAQNTPQAACAAVTYARRYALMAIMGIIGTDEDDDGNTASVVKSPMPAQKPKGNVDNALKAIAVVTTIEALTKIINTIPKSEWTETEKETLRLAVHDKKENIGVNK